MNRLTRLLLISASGTALVLGAVCGASATTATSSGSTLTTTLTTASDTAAISTVNPATSLQVSGTNLPINNFTGISAVNVNFNANTQTATLNDSAAPFNQAFTFTAGAGVGAATVTGAIDGSASVTVSGTGGVTFKGTNTYSGGTVITDGSLIVGDQATHGSITGNVTVGTLTANTSLVFYRSDAVTFAGNISGLGSVYQYGSGTLTLTGSNSYGGTTTVIDNGTIAYASDSNVGAGDVIVGQGTIQFNSSFTSTHNYQLASSAINTNGNNVTISGVLSTQANANVMGG
jgi:autotransporter-associated beta strand protein